MKVGDVVCTYVSTCEARQDKLRIGKLEKTFVLNGTTMAVIRTHYGKKVVNALWACNLVKPSVVKMKTLNLDAFL